MSLNALRIALQGLYELTPIAAAVQGLIEQIQEEQRQRQVAGQRGRPGSSAAPDLRDGQALATPRDDEDLERVVRDKWEAIERVRAQDLQPDAPAAPSVVDRIDPSAGSAPAASVVIPAPIRPRLSRGTLDVGGTDRMLRSVQAQEARARRQRNAAAIALILAELD